MDKVRDTFETNVGAEESADLVYWIWLSLAIGAGSSAAGKLFSRFGQNVRAIRGTPQGRGGASDR